VEQSWKKALRRPEEGIDAKDADVASPTRKGFHPQILAGQKKWYEKDTSKEEATSVDVSIQAFVMISHTHPPPDWQIDTGTYLSM